MLNLQQIDLLRLQPAQRLFERASARRDGAAVRCLRRDEQLVSITDLADELADDNLRVTVAPRGVDHLRAERRQVLQHFLARGQFFGRRDAVLIRADADDRQRFATRRNLLGDERQRRRLGGRRRRECGPRTERQAGADRDTALDDRASRYAGILQLSHANLQWIKTGAS